MPTIKHKVEMNLPQLIEWAWKNKIKNLAFYSNKDGGSVYFNKDGVVYVEHEIAKTETFTVETEEEITEDTEFETLIEVTEHQTLNIRVNRSIKEIKHFDSIEFHALVNGRLTLIWTKEEGLVE